MSINKIVNAANNVLFFLYVAIQHLKIVYQTNLKCRQLLRVVRTIAGVHVMNID